MSIRRKEDGNKPENKTFNPLFRHSIALGSSPFAFSSSPTSASSSSSSSSSSSPPSSSPSSGTGTISFSSPTQTTPRTDKPSGTPRPVGSTITPRAGVGSAIVHSTPPVPSEKRSPEKEEAIVRNPLYNPNKRTSNSDTSVPISAASSPASPFLATIEKLPLLFGRHNYDDSPGPATARETTQVVKNPLYNQMNSLPISPSLLGASAAPGSKRTQDGKKKKGSRILSSSTSSLNTRKGKSSKKQTKSEKTPLTDRMESEEGSDSDDEPTPNGSSSDSDSGSSSETEADLEEGNDSENDSGEDIADLPSLDAEIRIAVLGDAGVGKTSLISRFMERDLGEKSRLGAYPTASPRFDVLSKVVELPSGRKAKLILQDNMSVEAVLNPWPIIHGCIVMFSCSPSPSGSSSSSTSTSSVSSSSTFSPSSGYSSNSSSGNSPRNSGTAIAATWKTLETAKQTLKVLRKQSGQKKVKLLLVGNKCDSEASLVDSFNVGRKVADQYEAMFMLTSSKSVANVRDAFLVLAQRVLDDSSAADSIPSGFSVKRSSSSSDFGSLGVSRKLMDDLSPVKNQGVLTRFRNDKKWKRSYFVLKGKFLYYYKLKDPFPSGIVHLFLCATKLFFEKEKPFCWEVSTPKLQLRLSAESNLMLAEWVDGINSSTLQLLKEQVDLLASTSNNPKQKSGSGLSSLRGKSSSSHDIPQALYHSSSLEQLQNKPYDTNTPKASMALLNGRRYDLQELRERHALLQELRQQPDNMICGECSAKGTTHISWWLGMFVCEECAPVHQSLGCLVSKIDSLGTDITEARNWPEEALLYIVSMGNKRANEFWESHIPVGRQKPRPSSEFELKESWIKSKYLRREFSSKKEGYLSLKEKDWKRRWVVLTSSTLDIYYNRDDLLLHQSIDLLSSSVLVGSNDQFYIFTPDQRFLFDASSQFNVLGWVTAVKGSSERLLSSHSWTNFSLFNKYASGASQLDAEERSNLIKTKRQRLGEVSEEVQRLTKEKAELEARLYEIQMQLERHSQDEAIIKEELSSLEAAGGTIVNKSSDGLVQSGTFEQLLEVLVSEKPTDIDFPMAFLITYRTFTTPHELLTKLLAKFNDAKVSKQALCTVLKFWLSNHRNDFEDEQLRSSLLMFINSRLAFELPAKGEELRETLLRKFDPANDIPLKGQIPEPIIPKRLTGRYDELLDFDSVEFARHLTMVDHTLYRKITPKELLLHGLNSQEQLPNLNILQSHIELFTGWVKTEVLKEQANSQRALIIEKFIYIASICKDLGNYNGIMCIISGLSHPSLRRLTKSWPKLHSPSRQTLDSLQRLVSSKDNFPNLRKAINSAAPCVPFIGLFLSELQEINKTLPDLIGEKAINFNKRRRISVVLRQFQRFQKPAYVFKTVPEIENYLRNISALSVDDCFLLSYLHQPKIGREVLSLSFPSCPVPVQEEGKESTNH